MNFVFISPNFPSSMSLFCQSLRNNGINVLGIGDQEYNSFSYDTKNAITDYYKVQNLDHYDELVKACGYFTYRYGKIDFIDSLNEHWMLNDGKLRSDFNVFGFKSDYIIKAKKKSSMKEFYAKAGVPFARYCLITSSDDLQKIKDFTKEVGFPVVIKPNIGVGASRTYRIKSLQHLEDFWHSLPEGEFIVEEFIPGNIMTFDGITDQNCKIVYAASHFLPDSLMDIVNNDTDVCYHSQAIDENLFKIGQNTLTAFNAKKIFFHLEFFKLYEDKLPLGKKGDIIALEANLRPGGAYIPDMINYAANIDIYQMWADMICDKKIINIPEKPKFFCGYVGCKFGKKYKYSHSQILEKYSKQIVLTKQVEKIFAPAMGNFVYIFRSESLDEIKEIINYIIA